MLMGEISYSQSERVLIMVIFITVSSFQDAVQSCGDKEKWNFYTRDDQIYHTVFLSLSFNEVYLSVTVVIFKQCPCFLSFVATYAWDSFGSCIRCASLNCEELKGGSLLQITMRVSLTHPPLRPP